MEQKGHDTATIFDEKRYTDTVDSSASMSSESLTSVKVTTTNPSDYEQPILNSNRSFSDKGEEVITDTPVSTTDIITIINTALDSDGQTESCSLGVEDSTTQHHTIDIREGDTGKESSTNGDCDRKITSNEETMKTKEIAIDGNRISHVVDCNGSDSVDNSIRFDTRNEDNATNAATNDVTAMVSAETEMIENKIVLSTDSSIISPTTTLDSVCIHADDDVNVPESNDGIVPKTETSSEIKMTHDIEATGSETEAATSAETKTQLVVTSETDVAHLTDLPGVMQTVETNVSDPVTATEMTSVEQAVENSVAVEDPVQPLVSSAKTTTSLDPTLNATENRTISSPEKSLHETRLETSTKTLSPRTDTFGSTAEQRIRLGICAMDKKARSKPMGEILSRLNENIYDIIYFGDSCLLNSPIEEWPTCDVLIAFFSKGYPLDKVKRYVAYNKMKINLNDLDMQILLQDRRRVYDLLEASGIDVPKHVYVSRDGYVSTGTGAGNKKNKVLLETEEQNEGVVCSKEQMEKEEPNPNTEVDELLEFDDHIEVNGVIINKPFVEKPVNAEDHNISIYYPTSAGGGCKKLFRKVGNRSSEFYPFVNEVRRDGGSYIYEEFVETQGTDVKMYTVGPEYGHAEARKSPTVDGKVQRNSDGKEVRFPVILTFREKEIARRIVLNFKQFICGFDILRVQEGHSLVSYVCDVNGFSFVKNSRKYYDDCAQILNEHILAVLKPTACKGFSTLDPLTLSRRDDFHSDDKRISKTLLYRAARMLLGQPTQEETDEDEKSDSALDSVATAAATLVEGALPVREFPNNLTSEPPSMPHSRATSPYWSRQASGITEETSHQEELRCVVAIIRHGDRTPKQKLKTNLKEPHILEFFHKHVKDCKKDLKVKAKAPLTEFLETVKITLSEIQQVRSADTEGLRYQLIHMRDILERWKIVGLNRKLQIKPIQFEDYLDDITGEQKTRCTEVQLILKWGGNLTILGEKQAIALGRRLRVELYPDTPGGGILRLHSTFRHDLKIKTSDEGRVMKTAAACAKGLLELEGDLPPILVSLVHKEKGSMHMLDPSGNKEVKKELDECKERISRNLQRDIQISEASEEELESLFGPKSITSIRKSLSHIENPRKMLVKIYSTMGELLRQLEDMLDSLGSGDEGKRFAEGEGILGDAFNDYALSGVKLYKGETLVELTERWRFIYDRLCSFDDDNNMIFDLSRIPDIHDNVRFDMLHNPHLGLSDTLDQLYVMAKDMADCVVPQEYGTTIEEKRSVGVKICRGLLEKIKYDLAVARADNEVDMRYMINMDYSSDLAINTMGRRIRTRLYFTSESHLHTVLNVLRFGSAEHCGSPMLSDEGIQFINDTPELCYLTQIVIRVFEDSRLKMANDPRRFRVEILFSPGANATPQHLQEHIRDSDTTRFDTASLQMIGRDGLTCEELEEFFDEAIQAGKSEGSYCPEDHMSLSTMPERLSTNQIKSQIQALVQTQKIAIQNDPDYKSASQRTEQSTSEHNDAKIVEASKEIPRKQTNIFKLLQSQSSEFFVFRSKKQKLMQAESNLSAQQKSTESVQGTIEDSGSSSDGTSSDWSNDKNDKKDGVSWILSRKFFWGSIAIGSFVMGTGCLLLALRLNTSGRNRGGASIRRWQSTALRR